MIDYAIVHAQPVIMGIRWLGFVLILVLLECMEMGRSFCVYIAISIAQFVARVQRIVEHAKLIYYELHQAVLTQQVNLFLILFKKINMMFYN